MFLSAKEGFKPKGFIMNEETILLLSLIGALILAQIFSRIVRKRDIKWYDAIGVSIAFTGFNHFL
jgi:hypothetical protein